VLAVLLLIATLLNASFPQPSGTPSGTFSFADPQHTSIFRLRQAPQAAPFQLRLTPQNTAYQMILVGPLKRQLLAMVTALQLRKTDSERDILIQVKEPLAEPLMEVLEQLRVRVIQMPFAPMTQMEFDFGQSCSFFWACWMKLLTWNQTEYSAVLNIDTDFLVLRNMGGAFDVMEQNAQTPFDVGGVPDPVVALSHKDASLFDVFNGGMFLALPGREAYERMVHHAQASEWQWGEMLWLNTFATRFGHWVRLPTTFNFFPVLIRPNSPFLTYSPPNWDSIYGMHFAGSSRLWGDATAEECKAFGEKDCFECCLKWVQASTNLAELLSANADIVEKGPEVGASGGAAWRVFSRLLPSGWEDAAAVVVKRNAARGYTFDKEAWHDGYTGSSWADRERREAKEAQDKGEKPAVKGRRDMFRASGGKGEGAGAAAPAGAAAAPPPPPPPPPPSSQERQQQQRQPEGAAPDQAPSSGAGGGQSKAPVKIEPAFGKAIKGLWAYDAETGGLNESSLLEGALRDLCFSQSGFDSNGDESVFTLCGYAHVKQNIPGRLLT